MIYLYGLISAVIVVGTCYIFQYVQHHQRALDQLYETLNERMSRIQSFIKKEYAELTLQGLSYEDQIHEINKKINTIEQKIEEFIQTKKKVGRPRVETPRNEK